MVIVKTAKRDAATIRIAQELNTAIGIVFGGKKESASGYKNERATIFRRLPAQKVRFDKRNAFN